MSKVCELCGKGKLDGKKVSHSNHKTNKKSNPNLVKLNGKNVCTKCYKKAKNA